MEATWATVSLKASHSDKCQRFTLHAVQLKPKSSVKTLEYYKVSTVAGQGRAWPVRSVCEYVVHDALCTWNAHDQLS